MIYFQVKCIETPFNYRGAVSRCIVKCYHEKLCMWGNQSENRKAVKGLLQTVGRLRGFTNVWHKINDVYSEIRVLGPL